MCGSIPCWYHHIPSSNLRPLWRKTHQSVNRCHLLTVKDCSSIKRDPTWSSCTTLFLQCASKGWWWGCQEKNCTVKTNQSPTLSKRIVLKPDVHCGRQDTTSFDARTSAHHSSEGKYREICHGEIDFRMQWLPYNRPRARSHPQGSSPQVESSIRNASKSRCREAVKADLKQNHAFNPFSEQSKEMIYCMGNMEYFEMCEITPKVPCHNCMSYWTKSIVHCT